MSLLQHYEAAIERGELSDNPLQREVLYQFQELNDKLAVPQHPRLRFRRSKAPQGIYLHGPVGVGKTHLMDLFFQNLSLPRKARFHFHHFMQQVDHKLRQLQGKDNPLQRIAAELAQSTQLLCLDEFLVFDVADAMILTELLQALFKHQIVLVVTSNTPPDDLYLHGVQRDRFLPAIDLIKEHCDVLLLAEQRDYRLGRTPQSQRFFYPLSEAVDRSIAQQFNELSNNDPVYHDAILVQSRLIPCVRYSTRVVWFDFAVICNIPRCHLDYLEIAERFAVVIVSNIPVLGVDDTTRVILMIHLIDVLYDRGIILVASAEVDLSKLYVAGPMYKSFQRTLSRLQEMQSIDYI